MAKPNQDLDTIPSSEGKTLVNQDGSVTKLIEWATQNLASPEEALDFFMQSGVEVSSGEELTGEYALVPGGEKQTWMQNHAGKRLFLPQWNFYNGDNGEFAAFHVIADDGKFIINDGTSTGIYHQLRQITDRREAADPGYVGKRTSTAGLMVPRGVRRKADFWYDDRTKTAIPKKELENIPAEFKKKANPVWQFDF